VLLVADPVFWFWGSLRSEGRAPGPGRSDLLPLLLFFLIVPSRVLDQECFSFDTRVSPAAPTTCAGCMVAGNLVEYDIALMPVGI
jgi:hypothetical protein